MKTMKYFNNESRAYPKRLNGQANAKISTSFLVMP